MIDREALAAVRAREQPEFDSRTRRSAELGERARRSMPDGVPMAWMAGLYGHRPLFVAHGEGCRFTDVDGTSYVDFNQADLSATCGFAPPAVLEAIAERASRGLQFLLPVEEAIEAAELLAERYGLPAWQFTLSASGANAEAIRLARHRTGRDVIVVFGGHYHGHLDDTLVEGDEHGARPHLLGVNPRAAADTRVVPFNDLAALERVLASAERRRGDHRARAHQCRRRAPRRRVPRGHARARARARGAARARRDAHADRRLRRPDARVGPGARRDRTRQEHRRRDPDRRLRDDGRPARLDGAPSRRLRRRARARHRRDDLCQPAFARGHGRDAARDPDARGVRAGRVARRAARRRDRGRRGARRAAVARASARRPLRLLPGAGAAARRARRGALARHRADRHAPAVHGEPGRMGCDRGRRPGGVVRAHGG